MQNTLKRRALAVSTVALATVLAASAVYAATTIGSNISTAGTIYSTISRATSATGSQQSVSGDMTYAGNAGGTSTYHAGMMGNFMGDTLTNTTSSYHAGVIGSYSVTTSDASTGAKAGVIGEVGDLSVADAAFMAVLGGDSGALTPNAAYGVQYFNSTAGSHFNYGLDLFHAATTDYGSPSAVDYGTADIRLQNGETISNGTDSVFTLATNTANADTITVAPKTGGAATFDGKVTSADLTAARTWTMQDATGTVRLAVATGTSTVDLASVNSAACTADSSDVTTTGAALGDGVTVTSATALQAGVFLIGRVTATNTSRYQLCNLSGSAVDRASDTYTLTVTR